MTPRLVGLVALVFAALGCTTETERREAMNGYCIRNLGVLKCDANNNCPCTENELGIAYACDDAGTCQLRDGNVDGGVCIYGSSGLTKSADSACGCDADCESGNCNLGTHLCR